MTGSARLLGLQTKDLPVTEIAAGSRTAKVFSIRQAAPRQQRDGQRLKNPFRASGKVNDPWTPVEGDLASYLR
jgi:hypothetical protein